MKKDSHFFIIENQMLKLLLLIVSHFIYLLGLFHNNIVLKLALKLFIVLLISLRLNLFIFLIILIENIEYGIFNFYLFIVGFYTGCM